MPPPKVDTKRPPVPPTPPAPPPPPPAVSGKKRAADAKRTADAARENAAKTQIRAQRDDKKARDTERVNKAALKEKEDAEQALGKVQRPGDTGGPPPDKRVVKTAEDKVARTGARASETTRDARVAREQAEASRRVALERANAALDAQKVANTEAKAAGLREPFPRAAGLRDVYDAGSLDEKAQQRLFGARTPVTPSEAAKADAERVAEATQRSPREGAEELSRQLSLSTDSKYHAALLDKTSPQTDRIAASLKDPKTPPEDARATVKELARSASLGGADARRQIAGQLHHHSVSPAEVLNADSKDRKVAELGNELARQQRPEESQYSTGFNFSLARGPAHVEFAKEVDQRVKRENGFVTATVETELSLTSGGQASVEKATVGAELSAGLSTSKKMSYEFKVTEADYERIKKGELPPPNPLDPSTLPDKGSVKVEQSQLSGTALDAGVRYHALELGTQDSTKSGKGMSVEMSRDKDKVKVTQGPSELFESDHRLVVGARVGDWKAEAHLGRKDAVGEYKLRTAEFDLGTKEGKQAFEKYQETGRIPEKPTPGVDKMLRLDKLNYDSQSKLGASFGVDGPLPGDELEGGAGGEASLTLQKNTLEQVVEHRPDGSRAMTTQVGYSSTNSTATIKSEFDKTGKPIPGKDSYEVTLNPAQLDRGSLVYSWTSDHAKAQRARDQGGPITVTLTSAELARMRERVSAASSAYPSSTLRSLVGLNDVEFVARLSSISPHGLANDLDLTNDPARPGGTPLPGSIAW